VSIPGIHVCALVRRLPLHAPHAPHAPLTPLLFHSNSPASILRELKAEKEKEKLAHTKAELNKRMVELLAQEHAKAVAVEEEKRKALATPSAARLRWVRAINKVLFRNCLKRMKARLLNSNAHEAHEAHVGAEQSARRRSQPNLPQLVRQDSAPIPLSSSSSSKHMTLTLDPMERRRQAKAERDSKLKTVGKLGKAKSVSQTARKPALPKSSSAAEVAAAFKLQLIRTTSKTSASDIQRILAPHLFVSSVPL
jgi:hypothetical protein